MEPNTKSFGKKIWDITKFVLSVILVVILVILLVKDFTHRNILIDS